MMRLSPVYLKQGLVDGINVLTIYENFGNFNSFFFSNDFYISGLIQNIKSKYFCLHATLKASAYGELLFFFNIRHFLQVEKETTR